MLPVISLGPLQLPVPQLVLVLSLAFSFILAERWARRTGVPTAVVSDGLFWGILVGLATARLMYVLRYPEAFRASPLSVLSPNPGLLDPVGGLVGAGLFLWLWGQRRGYPLLRLLDGITPFFAGMQVGLALFHAARGSYFGMATSLPWAVYFLGEKRHPTALYWAVLALLILLALHRRLKTSRPGPPGWVFWPFLVWSAGAYVFIEGLRGDARVLGSGWRVGHLVALPVLALALWQWDRLHLAGRTTSSTRGGRA